jgi:hypothetical protein
MFTYIFNYLPKCNTPNWATLINSVPHENFEGNSSATTPIKECGEPWGVLYVKGKSRSFGICRMVSS